MKRILFIAAMLCGSLPLVAQEAGDHYLGVSFGATFKEEQSSSPETSVAAGGEFAYFPLNYFRVGLAVGVPYYSYSAGHDDMLGVQINPNIAYYVKLTDNVYYSPEIGGAFEIGSYRGYVIEKNITKKTKRPYQGWDAYVHLFALEFRVNKNFAVGVNIGSMVYSTVESELFDDKITRSSVLLSFNNSTVQARFYF